MVNRRESSSKKSKSKIIRLIVDSLAESSKSLYGLSKEIGSNWDTIKANVELLENLGIIKIINQKAVLVNNSSISIYDDVIAGLPISSDSRTKIYTLAKGICDNWECQVGTPPNNTQLHKSLVEVAERLPELDIPRGWYFYGKVVLVNVNREKLKSEKFDLKHLKIDATRLKREINNVVDMVSKMTTSQLIEYQYNQGNKTDYILRRKIENLFYKKPFEKEKFANYLYELIFTFEVVKDDPLNHNVISIIKDAISMMISFAYESENIDDLGAKSLLLDVFSTMWKLYGTYHLLKTLEGDLGYDKEIVKFVFEEKIGFYKTILNDQHIHSATAAA